VAPDDGRDDGEQFGGHGDDAFSIALGRGDHEQGDDLSARSLVLPDAEVGEFQGLFYSNS
jgi:hypothetical protein